MRAKESVRWSPPRHFLAARHSHEFEPHPFPLRLPAWACLSQRRKDQQVDRTGERWRASLKRQLLRRLYRISTRKLIVSAPFSLQSLKLVGPEVPILRDTVYNIVTSFDGHAAYRSVAPSTLSLVAAGVDGHS